MDNPSYIKLLAASSMGHHAARMRLRGETPSGLAPLEAQNHGAKQWAEALGITDPAQLRVFTSSFILELNQEPRP